MIKKIVLLCSISLATNLCLALEESLDRTSTTTVVNKMEAFEGVTFEMPVLTTRQKGIISPIVIPITKIIDFGVMIQLQSLMIRLQ